MATFVMIPSAWQRPAHWRHLVTELECLGHRAVVPDLPMDVPGVGALALARQVVDALDRSAGPPVLVGHSMSGLVIPVVADLVPPRLMVFIAGMVPVIGMSGTDAAPEGAATPRFVEYMEQLRENEDDSTEWPPGVADEALFGALPPEQAAEEAALLRRHYYTVWDEPTPLQTWPHCPVAYLVCADDEAVTPAWQHRVAEEMLGVEPVEILGGHYTFLSRPAELAEVLVALADDA